MLLTRWTLHVGDGRRLQEEGEISGSTMLLKLVDVDTKTGYVSCDGISVSGIELGRESVLKQFADDTILDASFTTANRDHNNNSGDQ